MASFKQNMSNTREFLLLLPHRSSSVCFSCFFDTAVASPFSFPSSFFSFSDPSLTLSTSIVACAPFAYTLNPKTHTASQASVLSSSSSSSPPTSLSETFFLGSATAGVFLVPESESLDSDSESESGGASMSLHQLRSSSLMSSRVSSFSSASGLRSNATAARAGVSL